MIIELLVYISFLRTVYLIGTKVQSSAGCCGTVSFLCVTQKRGNIYGSRTQDVVAAHITAFSLLEWNVWLVSFLALALALAIMKTLTLNVIVI